jgi:hypothetical protein
MGTYVRDESRLGMRALSVCVVIQKAEPDRFERAALRWLCAASRSCRTWSCPGRLRAGLAAALLIGAVAGLYPALALLVCLRPKHSARRELDAGPV